MMNVNELQQLENDLIEAIKELDKWGESFPFGFYVTYVTAYSTDRIDDLIFQNLADRTLKEKRMAFDWFKALLPKTQYSMHGDYEKLETIVKIRFQAVKNWHKKQQEISFQRVQDEVGQGDTIAQDIWWRKQCKE